MKQVILCMLLILGFECTIISQIGIGTANPNPSAILHLETTGKGFLPPRLSKQQRDSMQSPANGLMIYNTTSSTVEFYNGVLSQWVSINGNLPLSNQYQSDYLSVITTTSNAYGFFVGANGVGIWNNISLGSNGSVALVATKSAVIAYTSNNTNAFYKNATGNGIWLTQTLNGTTPSASVGENVAIVFNNLGAYAFYKDLSGAGVWLQQSFGTTSSSVTCSIAPNDMAIIKTNTNAYIFYLDNQGQGHWSGQAIIGGSSIQIFSK